MNRMIDLNGHVFGRLVVISRAENKGGRVRWLCQCICGKKPVCSSSNLRFGRTKSCGCLNRELLSTHGMWRSPEHISWAGMKSRCLNPKISNYSNYGGRGILLCKRWFKFENFYTDMGDKPTAKHSIDRIDSNGNYEPENCRWATSKEQHRNRNDNVWIEFDERRMILIDWSNLLGIKYHTLLGRFRRGWSIEKTFTTPLLSQGRKPKRSGCPDGTLQE